MVADLSFSMQFNCAFVDELKSQYMFHFLCSVILHWLLNDLILYTDTGLETHSLHSVGQFEQL